MWTPCLLVAFLSLCIAVQNKLAIVKIKKKQLREAAKLIVQVFFEEVIYYNHQIPDY